jgi:hypothetical protein
VSSTLGCGWTTGPLSLGNWVYEVNASSRRASRVVAPSDPGGDHEFLRYGLKLAALAAVYVAASKLGI